MRFEVETNIYNPSALARKFASIQTSFDVTLGKIAAIISDSEIQQYLDGHTTMNTRLSSVVQDINGVHSQISAMQTEYSDGFDLVDSQLSTVDQTLNGIRAEVSTVHSEYQNLETRISSAELQIEPNAIINTVRSSQSYKTDINAKSATYTGDYVPTTSNLPASSWTTSEMKQSHLNDTFLTSGGEVYQYISGHNGLMITFTYDSETEATRYDYVRIYYKIGETTYVLPDIGGKDISGASVFVPSNEFWLYWRSDSSVTKYGFKIASIEWTFSNTPTLVESTLPDLTPEATSGTTYPETTHPYTNNEEKFWKYTTANTSSVSPSYGWAERGNHGIDSIAERLTNTEERMSVAELKITDSAIVSTVTSSSFGQVVTSTLKQTAEGIHLDAKYVSWNSTYSSMTKDGKLSCFGANIVGDVVMEKLNCRTEIASTYYYTNDWVAGQLSKFSGNGLRLKSLLNGSRSEFIVVPSKDYTYQTTLANNECRRVIGIVGDAESTSYGYDGDLASLDERVSINYYQLNYWRYADSSSNAFHCHMFFYQDRIMIADSNDRTSSTSYYLNKKNIISDSYGILLSSPKHYLQVTDSYRRIDGYTIQVASSKRYKHNIRPITDEGLDPHRLLDLPVKEFIYNEDYTLGQYHDTIGKLLPGFIAEDVDEIYPSAVVHHPETGEVESWDERRIIPGMLALIQELYQRVEELENKL